MASFASSELVVRLAWASGILSIAIALALTLQMLRIRRRTARTARRRAAFVRAWRPILFRAALGEHGDVPAVDPDDEETLLALWNEVQEALHSDARAALNRLADGVGLRDAALRQLRGAHPVGKVQALRALGHLGRGEDYPVVRHHLADPRGYLSLTAARALVRIDAERAPADVLPGIAARTDWPASLLATALAWASPDTLASCLLRACAGASGERLVRLLPLVELVDARTGEEILRRAIATSADADVVAAALKAARVPSVADLARAHTTHASWVVRTQAAAALGRIGAPADRRLLVACLEDPSWWVRYRAAQALVSGRFGSVADLAATVQRLDDRYSRDMFVHVLAERRP